MLEADAHADEHGVVVTDDSKMSLMEAFANMRARSQQGVEDCCDCANN